ncbi:MAG TPA: cytochrome P450 [Longimicrobiaceae bacterium]|nr:cytochrome P450 [Longimicrobiaceae bacterium]
MASNLAPPLPPGPRTRLPGGDLLAFRRDPLGTLERLAREHGDVAAMRFGPRRVTLLGDPDLVREVLVARHREFIKSYALQRARVLLGEGLLTSEEPLHLRQRRLSQPAFHRERIAGYAADMVAYAARMAGEWRDGAEVDAAREMNRLTLAIAGKTLFGAEVAGEAEEIARALTEALGLYRRLTNPLGPLLDRLPTPGTLRMRRARARLDATIHRIIAERRRDGGDRGDLLSMLLLAQDTEGDGGGMSDLQLRDEALTIFLAGHETTANALSWTWHLLARNPEAEAALHAELDRVLGDRLPTADDLPSLPYTRSVLAESMRVFPPAYVLGRQPLRDMEIGGYRVDEGSIVLMSPWVIQRDPRWWPDPLRFDPGRWTPEMEAALPKFAYFPFGGGPRKCIGEGFAWTEGILVLAVLARRWRVRPVPGHPVETEPMITLRPRHGLRATLERRA